MKVQRRLEKLNLTKLKSRTYPSPEEYATAKETILDAFYTPNKRIKGMYEVLITLDSKAVGLNHQAGMKPFYGALPIEMQSTNNVFTGVEIDSITGNIAKLLYPNRDIRVQGFEKTTIQKGFYDVVIGNVPFGKTQIFDKKYPKGLTSAIHNYFIAKSIDSVRDGGLVFVITSSKTLDSQDTSGIREYIKSKADFLGAVRLPNTAFKKERQHLLLLPT